MPFFIKQTVRKTFLKYLVEAEDEDQAYEEEKEEYIGYLDGEVEEVIIGCPFETADAAMADASSYTEGQ